MADIEAQIHNVTEDRPASTTANPQRPQPAVIETDQSTTTTADPQTPDSPHPRPPNTANAQPQATSTNDRSLRNPPPSQNAGNPDPQRGEKYGDSSDGLWSIYLTEAEKQDKDVTESWKGDTDGILFFTGLFSATVAAFLVESYKKLSPDPAETTNALLTQLSVQLFNISSGIPLASIAAQRSQPFSPAPSAVRVNVLWFLSLVLSLTCALSATLMQQWARRYQELAQHHRDGAPHRRAHMRAYIFYGINRFEMARAVATMPALLHISVFLFFAGLIDFLFPIDKTVSYVTLGWVVAFALAYAALTVLPNLYLNCPYATPLSGFTWRLSHFSVIVALKAALGIEDLFHNSLLKLWSQVNQHARVTGLGVRRWREALKNQVKVHRQWLSDGLRKSIERDAKGVPSTAVTSALRWTLTALDEDKEIESFAAGVPGFFNSRTVPDATLAILPLMSGQPQTNTILGSRLYDLLKTCIPMPSPLNNEERQSRLRVCMKCLWYFARAYNQPGASEPLPSYFPGTLASPEITSCIQTEQDPVIRVIGRCFGALVVTKLADGVKSSTDLNVQISDEQLACLSAILGTESNDVRLCLTQPGAVQLANLVSLALDDVTSLVPNAVPSDVLDMVGQTLDILSQALPAEETIELPSNLSNAQINISGGKFDRVIVSRLHDFLQMCISSTSRLTDEVRRSCLRVCLKSLWCCAKAYHQLGPSVPLPRYFLRILATPEIIRHIQQEGDRTSRLIGYCFQALVVTKLAADFDSGTVRVSKQELVACLSAILGAESHDVKVWLRLPGAIEHMGLFFLALSEVGSVKTSWIDQIERSDVLDVIQQTFSILSHTLPAGVSAEPWLDPVHHQVGNFGGEFTTILQYRLKDLLEMCTIGTTLLTDEARIMRLKSLWHYEIEIHRLRALGTLPALDIFPIHLVTPEISRRIHTEEDLISRVVGRCFGSLVVNMHAAGLNSHGGYKLTCLSAILGTENRQMTHWLSQPGVVQLVNMVSLALDEVCSFVTNTLPPDVLHIVGKTISVLAQDLPAGLKVELQLHQADTLLNVSEGPTKSVVLSHLLNLLKTCALRASPLPEEIRTSCLQMCLNGLWNRGKAHHRLGASRPLPPDFLDLAGLELTRHIRTETDQASRVMGRCVEALVVGNLVTRIKSRTDPTVQISDKVMGYLSAILGTESGEVIHWLGQPGIVELANIVILAFGDTGSLTTDTVPPYVLDAISQTFSILSQALPAEISTELGLDKIYAPAGIPDGTAPIMGGIHQNHSITCLKNLWRCVLAYNQPGNSAPLPSYVLIAFANPAMTRRIRTERDVAARVIGRCIEALVVKKLIAGIKSSTDVDAQISDEELAYLSAILGVEIHDVRLCLAQTGAVELANMVSLALGDVGSFAVNALPSEVLDVAQQTLAILSQALPAEETAELRLDQPISQLNISDGIFDRVIASRLHNFLQMYISSTLPLTAEVRRSCLRMCLKSLWYCAKVHHQLDALEVLPSYFFLVLSTPEITRHIRTEKDPVARVIGRCFGALVISKLVASIKSRTDSTVQTNDKELGCLSALLGAECHDVKIWLRLPGTVALANMASLTFNRVDSLVSVTMSPDMQDMIHQTLGILSQSLPAELNAKPRLNQINALVIASRAQFEHVVVSRLCDLFDTCTRRIPRLTEEVRTSCLRMCLKSLWEYGRPYHRLGAPKSLLSHLPLTLGGPTMVRRIHSEQDHAARVIGRCFESLIVNDLAARVKSRSDSPVLDKALECLSTIFGTVRDDVIHLLNRPGAVELANMVSLIFSEIHSLSSNTAPSDVLGMFQQTFSILAGTIPAGLSAELWLDLDKTDTLMKVTDGTSPLTEPLQESRFRACLKNLWHCARAYSRLGTLVPLPSFVRITLSSPEITRRIRAERDLAARVTGHCVWALIVNKLADDFELRVSFSSDVHDAELTYMSSILGTEPCEFLRWPRPSAVIKLQNVVSLMSGEIEALIASGTAPVDVLHIVQETLNTICSELVLGGVFSGRDLPMDRVLLLREICSKIANAQPANRFKDQTVEILDQLHQISKQLPSVEYRMRRCTSFIIDRQFIRGRSHLTTQSEYEVRRRRSKSM